LERGGARGGGGARALAGVAMAAWLVPPDVLATSPSREDGMTEEDERTYRRRTAIFIDEAGMELKFPRLTIATALVFFQRFFALQSFRQHKRFIVAVTCLFLAGKVEESPKKLQTVAIRCYQLWHRRKVPPPDALTESSPEYEALRQDILKCERILLHTMAFDLYVEHPFRYLIETVKTIHHAGLLRDQEERKKVAQIAVKLVNDSMRTNLCLQYQPQQIASAVIFLASMYLKVDIPDKDMLRWMEKLKLEMGELADLCEQVMQVYPQRQTEVKDGKVHPMRHLTETLVKKGIISETVGGPVSRAGSAGASVSDGGAASEDGARTAVGSSEHGDTPAGGGSSPPPPKRRRSEA